ncbi:hypothetical protein Poli38472_003770 [Pythium oligandrum]|uniref:Protein kinase domain-containing protein n=1 Tax=Pythium oligandrum TaxID=41045 RepID=A0A8K1CNT0_PYTOL|nr:hypothetical protein Poli38472_003770 [Pythium oligandrum]|eukprot:TMW66005.1 hypothetical protein Poli38472_003770 [Pythium oligandrum]
MSVSESVPPPPPMDAASAHDSANATAKSTAITIPTGSDRSGFSSRSDRSDSFSSKPSKKRSWWDRVVSFRRRKRASEEELSIDQDLYMRTILESYCSSLSSNRFSSVYYKDPRTSTTMLPGSRRAQTDENGGIYYAQPETPDGYAQPPVIDDVEDDVIMEDEDEKAQRRIQRRLTQQAIRAKLLERNRHRTRARKKLMMFALCIGLTLTAFVSAAVLIANVGVKTREEATTGVSNNGTNTTTAAPLPKAAVITSGSGTELNSSHSGSSTGTLPPLTGRTGLDLLTPEPGKKPMDHHATTNVTDLVYTYVHCVLMSLSLWMSLVVIAMHMTFRSFRTYSMPLVLELSCVQCGYWITSLLRVQFTSPYMNDTLGLAFCLAECFFNFGQIAFTCAIAFNMYRSVVSYADVLVDTHSANRRYRSYTLNVMVLSVLASIVLALVGYRTHDALSWESFQPCLYPTCRMILYVYYPLLAFFFNFIFYVRFKRSIGGAYPMSATGRLNSVARSYVIVFFVCWGSLIAVTALSSSDAKLLPRPMEFALQSIFDVLGVGTAVITLTNFHRCRKAFDFGLSLKAIDPHSVEFDEPLQILGEGSFAIVLKAKWSQRAAESSSERTIEVAVKTFKHTQFETLEQMKEEAYLASRLVHPCVMMTYGCYTIGNNLYIVSEYLGGGTLQDILDHNASLPYERALCYAHMIASGMRFLHGLPVPIIHRDLKPLNCIFDSEQEMLKIADFGESRLFRKEGLVAEKPNFYPSVDLTIQMTTNIGSACWAAPEVLKDEDSTEYSLKVDVYSFGVICWQLYTCKSPYTDIPGSVLALAEAVIAGRRPEIPADCPTLFAKIMRRCWHEDPVRRPNFEDIVQLLEMELSDVRQRDSFSSAASAPTAVTRPGKRLQIVTPSGE